MRKRNITIGYLLAFFLGALGAHAFYYGKYRRGLIYLCISVFISPLIPFMVILGWIDMFFLKKWHKEFENREYKKLFGNEKFEEELMPRRNVLFPEPVKEEKEEDVPLFYSEEENILDKYAHLKTPSYILESVERALNKDNRVYSSGGIEYSISINTRDRQFMQDSSNYRYMSHPKTREIPLKAYWTTFQDLNEKQLAWYLYWREQVLNKNYIDVDLSYIFLFVYELINYTFNRNAAFNVSMMVTIYEKYKDRHPELDNYLPRWIADMLYELEEPELAKEWDDEGEEPPKLYSILKEAYPLDRVSMSTWKEYIKNHSETVYFSENRNKVYNIFKAGMGFLEEMYENNSKSLIERWFEEYRDRKVRQLYQGAVVGREIEDIHIPVIRIRPVESLFDEVTAMLKLSENISREMNGFNRRVKVNEEALTPGIKEKMEEYFLKKQYSKKEEGKESSIDDGLDSRFKLVNNGDPEDIQGSRIPDPPQITDDEEKEEEVSIVFDDSRINDISQEVDQMIELFDSGVEGEAELSDFMEYDDGIDIQGFIDELSDVEISFILLFNESKDRRIGQELAQQFAKEHGVMLGVFLSDLNAKANEYLGEVLFEALGNEIEFNEDFELILKQLE